MFAFALAHFTLFWIYVNMDSFALAFIDKNTGVWNNFEYFKIFLKDIVSGAESVLLANLGNTMKYFLINTVCQLPLAMFLSYFLYKSILGRGFFMTVFIMPMIISTVVLAAIYRHAVSPAGHIGMLYAKLTGNEEGFSLLSNVSTATPAILIFCLWTGFGLNLIMFNGAMTRIPESIVESAKLSLMSVKCSQCLMAMPLRLSSRSTSPTSSCLRSRPSVRSASSSSRSRAFRWCRQPVPSTTP